jgi:hypothetical protein
VVQQSCGDSPWQEGWRILEERGGVMGFWMTLFFLKLFNLFRWSEMLAKRKTGVERMCNVSGLPEISCFTLI